MNKNRFGFGLVWIVISFWTGIAQSHTNLFPNASIKSTKIFLSGESPGPEDDTEVKVFYPDIGAQFPTVIVLQGGLVAGSSYSQIGQQLARFGFVVAIPNRMSLLGPPPRVPFPDELVVLEVLEQLEVENGKPASPLNRRVDVDRVGLVGHSVGGFVGLLVVEGSCVPPFCLPPFPFQRPAALKAAAFYGTNSFDPMSGQLIDVDTDDIPVALVNGSVDGLGTIAEAQDTFDILDGPRELITIDGANHYGITNDNNPPGAEFDDSPPAISQSQSIEKISQAIGEFLNENIFNLLVSSLADRSDMLPLKNTTLSDNAFVFLTPTFPQTSISQVDYFLDGEFVKTEDFAPYDLKGTRKGVLPRRLNTRKIDDGPHEVKAEIQFASGQVQSIAENFFVSNRASPTPNTSIKAVHSGQCLDVYGVSSADGANVIQWPCHGGSNQKWELVPLEGGIFEIVAAHSGKCLDVFGASSVNEANVIQWPCHGETNQQWQLVPHGDGAFQIEAVHSGQCLDVSKASKANAANVIQWPCHGGINQQWRLNID